MQLLDEKEKTFEDRIYENQVVRIVCVSRKITSPYPLGSIKQFKIRRWGRCCESTSRKI
jgi:hypothetical protein